MTFEFTEVPDWPPLAWTARCERSAPVVRVSHGPHVETGPGRLSEAVWDGPFVEGAFDETDVVFGSAARVRDGEAVFVSSAATTDRLQYHEGADAVTVSNSLVALLAVCGLRPDPAHDGYYGQMGSSVRGLGLYDEAVPMRPDPVSFAYAEDLRWDGQTLRRTPKPWATRDFGHFEGYRSFLDRALGALAENLRSPDRRRPFGTMGTLSSGYDTTAVMALLRPHGVEEAVTIRSARGGHDDTGAEAARVLGLRVHAVGRDDWRRRPVDGLPAEVPFLAADAKGEDVHLSGAGEHLAGRVVFTGYAGGTVWDLKPPKPGRGVLGRGDRSGLSLTEYRLWEGFVAVPVPFLGATQAADVRALGALPEMAPFHTDPSYNRPVARRIAEETGVPRDAFGQRKKAASVLLRQEQADLGRSLSSGSFESFAAWLGAGPLGADADAVLRRHRAWVGAGRALAAVARRVPPPLPRGGRVVAAVYGRAGTERLLPYLFPWAIAHATGRYRRA